MEKGQFSLCVLRLWASSSCGRGLPASQTQEDCGRWSPLSQTEQYSPEEHHGKWRVFTQTQRLTGRVTLFVQTKEDHGSCSPPPQTEEDSGASPQTEEDPGGPCVSSRGLAVAVLTAEWTEWTCLRLRPHRDEVGSDSGPLLRGVSILRTTLTLGQTEISFYWCLLVRV